MIFFANLDFTSAIDKRMGMIPGTHVSDIFDRCLHLSRPVHGAMQLDELVAIVANIVGKILNLYADTKESFFENLVIVKGHEANLFVSFTPSFNLIEQCDM